MKAALAGATMAAMAEPPRILSLTVAPDFGQAHSEPCVNGSVTVQHTIADPAAECWGLSGPTGCRDYEVGPTVHGSFTIGVTIGGSDRKGDPEGSISVSVAGLRTGGDCTVFASGTCIPAVAQPLPTSTRSPAAGSPARTTITVDGVHLVGGFRCGGRWPESVMLTVSCRCTAP